MSKRELTTEENEILSLRVDAALDAQTEPGASAGFDALLDLCRELVGVTEQLCEEHTFDKAWDMALNRLIDSTYYFESVKFEKELGIYEEATDCSSEMN